MEYQCLCEKPVIILHPNARDMILRAGAFVWRNKVYRLSRGVGFYSYANFFYDFPKHKFSPRRNRITLDNLDVFQSFDVRTGEVTPLYIAVPCGHCTICTHRKTKEFAFRCVAESYTNKCAPFFVTLTYNSKHLPVDGVCKRDVQNFIKRLRINLGRAGLRDDFRFVCTSEYGKHGSRRPHYHLLLWNLPTKNLHDTLRILQTAWSYRRHRKNVKDDSIGFVSVKPCFRVNYVLKYMYKSCDVPKGKNALFHLSSRGRKGGIGSAFCDEMADYIRKNPDLVSISCYDPASQKVVTCGLPQYFKRRIYKTNSLLVPKEIRDTYENYCYCIAVRNFYYKNLCHGYPESDWSFPYEDKINRLFSCLTPYVVPRYYNVMRSIFDKYSEHQNFIELNELICTCNELADKLLSFDLSCLDKVTPYSTLRENRKNALSKLTILPVDVEIYSENIKYFNNRVDMSRKL